MRHLSFLFTALTGCLATVGVYLYLTQRPLDQTLSFTVEPTAFDLIVSPGEHGVIVHLTNSSAEPRQIIGLREG